MFLIFLGVLAIVQIASAVKKYDATERAAEMLASTDTTIQNRRSMTVMLHLATGERLKTVHMIKTAQGRYKLRLKETYAGYDVIGFGVEADMDPKTGYTGTCSGEVIIGIKSDLKDSTLCIQSNETVLEIAMLDSGMSYTDPRVTEKHTKRKVFLKDNGKATWVYEVDFLILTDNTVSRPFYIIDACELTVLVKFDRVNNVTNSRLSKLIRALEATNDCEDPTSTTTTTPIPTTEDPVTDEDCDDDNTPTTPLPNACPSPARGVGGNLKTGKYIYGVQPRCINPKINGAICTLETAEVKVIDLKQSRTRTNSSAASYTCSQGYSDEINGAYSPVMDAFYFGYTTVQAIKQWYKIDPLGFKPILYVHYGHGYENAFWDGVSLTFGDGLDFFYPLVSLDVVAHELGHGITTRFSNLFYSEQSGGINEAFSDITGELVEAFALSNDWRVGYELRKHADKALRYFKDPTKDGRSIKHASNYEDGLDVHYSSGLFNHAFYQLVEIKGMPIKEAYHCFIRANQMYWKERSTFEQGACGVLQSAHDLGFNSYLSQIKESFAVVGITLSDCQESSYMESLKDGSVIPRLRVSPDSSPMYMLDPPGFATSITITAKSTKSDPIGIELMSSTDGPEVESSENTLTYQIYDTAPLYLSLSADSFHYRVTLSIKYD